MQKKEYKELLFTDDFLFCKILTNNLNLLKDLLEMILDIPIQRVELAEPQKTMEELVDGRGIRLDVYVEDDAVKVFITPYGDRTGLSNDMIAFLDYLIQKGASSDLTYRIDKEVRKAQTREDWRLDYMTLDMIRQEEREEGWQDGHREGRTETIHQAVQSLMTQEDHLSLEHIKEQIQMMFHLSDTEIKEYLP